MKKSLLFCYLIIIAAVALVLAMGIGSVFIAPPEIIKIILAKLFAISFADPPADTLTSIFLKIRLPRALLAFIVGGAVSVSGVLVQSVLRNPLASPFTLGISSGAAVGASIAILCGFAFFGIFTLPFFGLVSGLLTVMLAVGLAAKLDKNMGNTAIILTGMAFSLFANSIIAFLMTWSHESAQRIIFWQLGSFALKDWSHPAILFPIVLIGTVVAILFAKEMDLMTFGEELAKASGVNVLRMKWLFLSIGAILTGCAVSITGVIGFVDFFTPHAARKIFGSKHRYVIPASVIMGGTFMVICDLIARVAAAPLELPVGAVTAAVGAPFFIYLYFNNRKGISHA